MKKFNDRTKRRLRGSTSLFLLTGMIPMMGIVALALEFGNVAVHQRRLQNYVDSKAVAALRQEFGGQIDIELYQFSNNEVPASNSRFDVDAEPVLGVWNFNSATAAFSPGPGSPVLSPGEVPAYQFEVDPFEVPLLWGPLFNVPSVDIRAESIAFAPRREIVIVQDVSGSMCLPAGGSCGPGTTGNTRLAQATLANLTLVQQMINQQLPGDQVGIIEFDSAPVRTLGLTDLSSNSQVVTNQINSITSGGNTNIAAGLQRGIDQFNATGPDPEIKRIIILIGDGVGGGDANGTADDADDLGIDVYTILYCNTGNGNGNNSACNGAAGTYRSLRRGEGTATQPQDVAALQQVMVDIVTGIPMKLVR